MKIGTNKPPCILPFDHRSSFEKNLYGWTGALSKEQTDKIARSNYPMVHEAPGRPSCAKRRAG